MKNFLLILVLISFGITSLFADQWDGFLKQQVSKKSY